MAMTDRYEREVITGVARPVVVELEGEGADRHREPGPRRDCESLLTEAIAYALNQWEWLTRFLDDGRIEIDFNTIERSMRPIALNRKNALFGGHDLGGGNWAEQRLTAEAWLIYTTQPQEGFLPWNSSNLPSQGRLNKLRIGQVNGLQITGVNTLSL